MIRVLKASAELKALCTFAKLQKYYKADKFRLQRGATPFFISSCLYRTLCLTVLFRIFTLWGFANLSRARFQIIYTIFIHYNLELKQPTNP